MDDVNIAIANFINGDYSSISDLIYAAKNSHVAASGCLGLAYQLGLGCEVNVDLSEKYFVYAAQNGHAESAHNLATFYITHKPEPSKSKLWYAEARRLGFSPGSES